MFTRTNLLKIFKESIENLKNIFLAFFSLSIGSKKQTFKLLAMCTFEEAFYQLKTYF